MAPEGSCFVGGCGDDTSWAIAADEDGFASELGVVALFDGCEEGVHVDVEDGAGGHGEIVRAAMRESDMVRRWTDYGK